MSSEGTAKTLVLVAAILELLSFIFGIIGLVFVFLIYWPWYMLLLSLFPLEAALVFTEILISLAFSAVSFIFGLIFAILWLVWRKAPSKHKTALIVTGVIAIVISVVGFIAPYAFFGYFGFLPGILAIVGGAIAKKGA